MKIRVILSVLVSMIGGLISASPWVLQPGDQVSSVSQTVQRSFSGGQALAVTIEPGMGNREFYPYTVGSSQIYSRGQHEIVNSSALSYESQITTWTLLRADGTSDTRVRVRTRKP